MKVKSESEVAQSCPTLCDPMDCSPSGSSVHGILQARVLEWVAIAFSGRHMQHSFSSSGHFPHNLLVGFGAQGWMEMPAYCLVVLIPCSCRCGSTFALFLAKPHQLGQQSLHWWKCTSDVPYTTWHILGLTEVKAREVLPWQNATLARVLLKFFIWI